MQLSAWQQQQSLYLRDLHGSYGRYPGYMHWRALATMIFPDHYLYAVQTAVYASRTGDNRHQPESYKNIYKMLILTMATGCA